jgi:hypothetical protein
MNSNAVTVKGNIVFVTFERDSIYGEYRSSLVFSKDEYDTLTKSDLDDIIDEHLNAWIEMVKPVDPIIEE